MIQSVQNTKRGRDSVPFLKYSPGRVILEFVSKASAS